MQKIFLLGYIIQVGIQTKSLRVRLIVATAKPRLADGQSEVHWGPPRNMI